MQARTHAQIHTGQGGRPASTHDHELPSATQEVREIRAAHDRICSALTQLAALDDKAEQVLAKESRADMDVVQAIQQLKAQKLDVWHEIQHLKKVGLLSHSIRGFLPCKT